MAIEYGDGSNSDTGRVIQVASTTKTNTFTTADASFVLIQYFYLNLKSFKGEQDSIL